MRKRLSSGEWGVLCALWRVGKRASVDDVRSELATGVDRDYRTIQTILHRCQEKSWITVRRERGRCSYTATIARDRGVEERVADFLAELAEGDPAVLETARAVLDRELERLQGRPGDGG